MPRILKGDSPQRLFKFVANARGRGSSAHTDQEGNREAMASQADAQRRLEMYAREHDNVLNIMWESAQNRFEIELNGSSEWPSENPCDPTLLDELAKPWPVYRWYSD